MAPLLVRVRHLRALTAAAGIAGNGLFVATVFAVHPRRSSGSPNAGWVRPSAGPARERAASLALVTGWTMQLFGIAKPRRAEGRRESIFLIAGLALLGAGTGLAVSAQSALGSAWRTTVVGTGEAPLASHGPYRAVRHPAYSAMFGAIAANVVIGRNLCSLAGAVLAGSGLELQARGVEEPALRQAFGDRYRRYEAVTGRFVPLCGRVRDAGGRGSALVV